MKSANTHNLKYKVAPPTHTLRYKKHKAVKVKVKVKVGNEEKGEKDTKGEEKDKKYKKSAMLTATKSPKSYGKKSVAKFPHSPSAKAIGLEGMQSSFNPKTMNMDRGGNMTYKPKKRKSLISQMKKYKQGSGQRMKLFKKIMGKRYKSLAKDQIKASKKEMKNRVKAAKQTGGKVKRTNFPFLQGEAFK